MFNFMDLDAVTTKKKKKKKKKKKSLLIVTNNKCSNGFCENSVKTIGARGTFN